MDIWENGIDALAPMAKNQSSRACSKLALGGGSPEHHKLLFDFFQSFTTAACCRDDSVVQQMRAKSQCVDVDSFQLDSCEK
ncbi:hypothetical protein Baya_0833 [Bagarius yarrelli]|uniref:Uncharacterized protein n=1 Tax=Bagarius yarrelli TaxID=175774 RepID=A0A556TJD0_BAGYA|nr:hypothetical protein Baya_0833 [Bagarius yarrelli]